MATSTSSASGSTVTVAAEVWTRPLDSVTGTRCTRCGPASCSRRLPGVGALDQEHHLVQPVPVGGALGEHLDLPAPAVGVADVHVVQVPGEEVRLLPALGAADLDDHVAAVVGVLREQERPQPLLERFDVASAASSRPGPLRRSVAGRVLHISPRPPADVSRARRAAPATPIDHLFQLLAAARGPAGASGRSTWPGRPGR